MRAFSCPTCGQLVFFENSGCLRCGSELGFDSEAREIVLAGGSFERCANAALAGCNWLVPVGTTGRCRSCLLTRTRPNDADSEALAGFIAAEAAKRRLIFQLLELGLPVVSRAADPEGGLAFDLLSSRHGDVITGHAAGVITVDLSESDHAHRERVRRELGEPYRTMLGHLRHESGHYYWARLAGEPGAIDVFRALFGDERRDYAAAIEDHYASPPPADWAEAHVSQYATMHPWEDWAETFAHYLHIRDSLQTAAAFGVRVTGPDLDAADGVEGLEAEPSRVVEAGTIGEIVGAWLPLTYALNAVNRSMGKDDLYPFVLAPAVIDKLGFVHDAVRRVAAATDAGFRATT